MNTLTMHSKILKIILVVSLFSTKAGNYSQEIRDICGERSCEFVFKKMKRFAKNGSPQAQIVVALMYRNGYGTDIDIKNSVKYMKRAAKNHVSAAQHDLGIMFRKGLFVEKDFDKGTYWLRKAANSGNRASISYLLKHGPLTKEENDQYTHLIRQPDMKDGEELIVVTPDKLTLTELSEQLAASGFNRAKKTGSRIPGRGCGRGASQCVSIQVNSPIGKFQFANMLSTLGAYQTAIQNRSNR